MERYGRVQSVKILARSKEEVALGGSGVCATVSFMDIKSASKAHNVEQKLDDRCLSTEYHEPAAIPSASPTISSHLYPAPTRPYIHGSPLEELGSFERSSHFYERERDAGYRGRPSPAGYHVVSAVQASPDPLRSRARDRTVFRAYPSLDSVVASSRGHHHRVGGWGYDSGNPRYTHHLSSSPDLSYSEDRRVEPPLIIVRNKHLKPPSESRGCSEDRSGSPSSSGSTGSHSGASSSCSSSSSPSPIPQLPRSPSPDPPLSDKSSSSHSHHGSSKSSAVPSHVSGVQLPNLGGLTQTVSEHKRHHAICIKNLPLRSSDTSLKDGLYHEYKRHGKVTCVKVVGQGCDRYALVFFKKTDDVEKAVQVSHDKSFFGSKIEVSAYQGYKDVDDNESRPYETELDEFHPKATRTLFIGNLEKDITAVELRKHFEPFGEIIEIDIKKGNNINGSSTGTYAFCQYVDITSVVKAMRTLDGEYLGQNRINLGFGKSLATTCVWIDGVAESVSEKYLASHFNQFGSVTHCVIDRSREHALVFFQQITHAQLAVTQMRGAIMKGRKLQVDFASRECQQGFYEHLDKTSGELSPRFTSQQQDNIVQLSPGSNNGLAIRGFETPSSSCSSAAGDKSYPRNSDEPRSNSSSVPNPQDMHNLQKERVSLLEQLEDCNSSGDEILNDSSKTKQVKSRSGTPLCDERPPESLTPPTQVPRSHVPISLPLPRFAVHVSNPLLSPPLSSPRRPQSSNSDDSQTSDPGAPGLEERLRSLDEKYEQWNGSRTSVLKLDSSVRLRSRYKLLDTVDKLEPSDIVKSVLAKPSVFDEDSKRLENFSDKYIPKEFVPTRTSPNLQNFRHQQLGSFSPLTPSSSGSSKSPPASSPATVKTQYPFPSHPQSVTTTQSCRTSPIDPRLPSDPRLLIDPRLSVADPRLSADSRGSFLTKQNICTINDNRYVPDILNTKDPRHPIHKDAEIKDGPEAFYRSKIRDEYTKNWLHTFERKESEPTYRLVDSYDRRRFSDFRKEEEEKIKLEQINKQKLLDGFVIKRKSSSETVVHPSPFHVSSSDKTKSVDEARNSIEPKKCEDVILKQEEHTELKQLAEEIKPPEPPQPPPSSISNIDEEKIDLITAENTIANILLSSIDNVQKKTDSEDVKVKIERTSSNESVSKFTSDTDKKKDEVIKKKEHERKKSIDLDTSKLKEKKEVDLKKNLCSSKSKELEVKSKELEFNMFEINRLNNNKKKEETLLLNGSKIKDSEKKKDTIKQDKKIELKKEERKKEFSHCKETDKKDDSDKVREKKKEKRDKDPSKHKERKKSLDENGKQKHENSKKTKEYKVKEDEKSHQVIATDSDCKANEDKEPKKDKRIDRNSISSNSSTGRSSKRRMSDSSENLDDSKRSKQENKISKDKQKKNSEKHISFISKILDAKNKDQKKDYHEKKIEKKKDERKMIKTPNLTETDDDDEDEEARERRKNHSIFEVVLDEPYVSMYDKVKARSTKNMQKQEEEKRQEKLKEKFSQLKQSRAKREEKKRSASYDGDSDSDRGLRRSSKLMITSSDDDDDYFRRKNQRPVSDSSENERPKIQRTVSDSYGSEKLKQRISESYENERIKSQRVSDSSENEKIKKSSKFKSRIQSECSDSDDAFIRKSSFSFDRIQNGIEAQIYNGHQKKKKQKKPKSDYSRMSSVDNASDSTLRSIKQKKKKHSTSRKSNINERMQDIFGSLSDEDNDKTIVNKWSVSDVFGTDSDTEFERKENKPKIDIKKYEYGNDVLKSLSHNVDDVTRKKKKRKKDKERTKEELKDERKDECREIRKDERKEDRKEDRRDDHKDNRKDDCKDEQRDDRKAERKDDYKSELNDDHRAELKEKQREIYREDHKDETRDHRKDENKEDYKNRKTELKDNIKDVEIEEKKQLIVDRKNDIKEMKNDKSLLLSIDERLPKETKHFEEIKVMDNLQTIIESKKKPEEEFVAPNSGVAITPERENVFSSFFDFDDSKGPEDETITIFKGDDDTIKTEVMFRKLDESKEDVSLFRSASTFEPIQREIIGFGSQMDDETAVKSISETPECLIEESDHVELSSTEEKTTPVISQEETEGAVAALLEASFGQDFCDSSYSDRSAKPDTPISDSELQIDTDDENSVNSIDDESKNKVLESSGNSTSMKKLEVVNEKLEPSDPVIYSEKESEMVDFESKIAEKKSKFSEEVPSLKHTDVKPLSPPPLSHNFRLPQMVIQQTSIRPLNINYAKPLIEPKPVLHQETAETVHKTPKLEHKTEDHVSVVKYSNSQISTKSILKQSVISCNPLPIEPKQEFISQPSVLQHTNNTQSCIISPKIITECDKSTVGSNLEKQHTEEIIEKSNRPSEDTLSSQTSIINFAKKSFVSDEKLEANDVSNLAQSQTKSLPSPNIELAVSETDDKFMPKHPKAKGLERIVEQINEKMRAKANEVALNLTKEPRMMPLKKALIAKEKDENRIENKVENHDVKLKIVDMESPEDLVVAPLTPKIEDTNEIFASPGESSCEPKELDAARIKKEDEFIKDMSKIDRDSTVRGRRRGGRGGRGNRGSNCVVTSRKTRQNLVTSNMSQQNSLTDVYEFTDEEEKINQKYSKSPEPPIMNTPINVATSPQPGALASTSPLTRKSRRLQEKDGSKSTLEETIDEVARGPCTRRITRSKPQTVPLLSLETSPRRIKQLNGKKLKAESPQPTSKIETDPSNDQNDDKNQLSISTLSTSSASSTTSETTTLIDPVSGLLIAMQESEEGQYVPIEDGGDSDSGMKFMSDEPPEKKQRIEKTPTLPKSSNTIPALAVTPNNILPATTTTYAVTPGMSNVAKTPCVMTTANSAPIGLVKPNITASVIAPTNIVKSTAVMAPSPPPFKPQANISKINQPGSNHQQICKSAVMHPPIKTHLSSISRTPPLPKLLSPKGHIVQAYTSSQSLEANNSNSSSHLPLQSPLAHAQSVRSPPMRNVLSPPIRVLVNSPSRGLLSPPSRNIPQSPQPPQNLHGLAVPPPNIICPKGFDGSKMDNSRCIVMRSPSPHPSLPGQTIAYDTSVDPAAINMVSAHHYMHPQLLYPHYIRDSLGAYIPPRTVKVVSEIDEMSPLELRKRLAEESIPDRIQHVNVPQHYISSRQLNHPLGSLPYGQVVPIHYNYRPINSVLKNYPIYWQGTLALKNDKALVEMHYLFGNAAVAEHSLQRNIDGELKLSQRMRLEQTQLDGVTRKMQIEDECCVLIAVPIGMTEEEWNQQSCTLHNGFITYLQQKQAAGIINITAPGSTQNAYIVHMFPPCDYINSVLSTANPSVLKQIASMAHLIIVIATV
ncbi:protein split ends isoform X2 [Daktulosphaira vitifoliae]|uniref:protein split ends isoform X2 n=1 Tax=Daktulosphaira vitifoliae TaxID=58002 RepID=UPI0021AAFDCF|nr:protein split ends isoform X2 [Daktulosphaira vitifoliae]